MREIDIARDRVGLRLKKGIHLLTRSVQTGAGPSGCVGQVLGLCELVLEVVLDLGLLVKEEGTVVEALDARVGGADSGSR